MRAKIDEILETLKHAKDKNLRCTLLIGAGCSRSAGIPLASELVTEIQREFKTKADKAPEQTYAHVMAQLTPGERRDIIAHHVDRAKINWAHVCIAQLMKTGYVDRVLTTNFDPLIMRACSLIGKHPAVYDFGVSQMFKPADVPGEAVFHLHGQRSGFVLLNTSSEFDGHEERLRPLFADATRGRVWIVVGYSGETDPVFNHLADTDCFDRGLYWIGYKDAEPGKHLRDKLLTERKHAYYVSGYDADTFFIKLTQELDIFPPDFISKPFTHLDRCMGMLTDFPMDGSNTTTDVTAKAREWINAAIRDHELADNQTARANEFVMAGEYDKLAEMASELTDKSPEELQDIVPWGSVLMGNAFLAQAKATTGDDADALHSQAYEKYAEALKIKSDMHEALNNWGVALWEQAKTKTGEEADALYAESCKKYDDALKIKPDKHDALNNGGIALSDQARTKVGEEADALYAEACEKYAEALKIRPDDHEVLSNWGYGLTMQANIKSGDEADAVYVQAREKLLAAEDISPGAGSYNLACLCSIESKPDECKQWLEKLHDTGKLPNREKIESDDDFDNVRESDWFKEFLDSL